MEGALVSDKMTDVNSKVSFNSPHIGRDSSASQSLERRDEDLMYQMMLTAITPAEYVRPAG